MYRKYKQIFLFISKVTTCEFQRKSFDLTGRPRFFILYAGAIVLKYILNPRKKLVYVVFLKPFPLMTQYYGPNSQTMNM